MTSTKTALIGTGFVSVRGPLAGMKLDPRERPRGDGLRPYLRSNDSADGRRKARPDEPPRMHPICGRSQERQRLGIRGRSVRYGRRAWQRRRRRAHGRAPTPAPQWGTGPNEIGFVATNKRYAVNECIRLGGGRSSDLSSQIASIVFGDRDLTVSQGYNTLSAEVMTDIYDASKESGRNSKDSGRNSIADGGTEETWSKGGWQVVQLIKVSGMGHAWPAGRGTSGGGGFIDHRSVNYPEVLSTFLFL
jgi:hypothetical protein